jgi:hypothetical protein
MKYLLFSGRVLNYPEDTDQNLAEINNNTS